MRLLPIAAFGLVAVLACNDKYSSAAEKSPPPSPAQNEGDATLIMKIRKTLQDDSALSIDAKNAKVAAHNGAVTLRGTVRDVEEKSAIEARILTLPGVVSVDNQLGTKNP